MDLNVKKRESGSKTYAKQLRRDGQIPAVAYGPKSEPVSYVVDASEFHAHLRALPKEQLSTTVFRLAGDGENRTAIIKEVQYHPVTYDVQHLDFEILADDVPVNVNVPVRCKGAAECVGVKAGGVLRRVLRQVRVNCLPKDIPQEIAVDVKDLELRQSKRLRDAVIPAGVRPLLHEREVLAIIAKR